MKKEINYYCDSCGKLLASHLGLVETCAQNIQLRNFIKEIQSAANKKGMNLKQLKDLINSKALT